MLKDIDNWKSSNITFCLITLFPYPNIPLPVSSTHLRPSNFCQTLGFGMNPESNFYIVFMIEICQYGQILKRNDGVPFLCSNMLQNAMFCDVTDLYMFNNQCDTSLLFSLAVKRSSVRFRYSPL